MKVLLVGLVWLLFSVSDGSCVALRHDATITPVCSGFVKSNFIVPLNLMPRIMIFANFNLVGID